jgi:hypothetical protein
VWIYTNAPWLTFNRRMNKHKPMHTLCRTYIDRHGVTRCVGKRALKASQS